LYLNTGGEWKNVDFLFPGTMYYFGEEKCDLREN
jgi:hypothetical protein